MRVLVTGSAGFIGFHVALALIERGDQVCGVDSLTPYYNRGLKEARCRILQQKDGFEFFEIDVADRDRLSDCVMATNPSHIVHLAAQPGARYSLKDPFAYGDANLSGHLSVLESARKSENLERLVYASSSAVYGGNNKTPFSESDVTDRPLSLYGATKRADELLSIAYTHMHGLEQTGLRFFTVYGPYGRPDMAYWLFTEAISKNQPISLFDGGLLRRDYTYIDDIVAGVLGAIDQDKDAYPTHRLYNLGNHHPESTKRLLSLIEDRLERKAIVEDTPAPPGELQTTYADIAAASRDLGFEPRISLEEGIDRFVSWYETYTSD